MPINKSFLRDVGFVEKLDFERAVQKCPDVRRAKAEERVVLLRTSIDEAYSVTQQMGVFHQPHVSKIYLEQRG